MFSTGASVPFEIRVDNPPSEAVDLEATFASFSEMSLAGGPAHVSPSAVSDEPLLLDQRVDETSETPATTSELGPIDGLAPRFTNG